MKLNAPPSIRLIVGTLVGIVLWFNLTISEQVHGFLGVDFHLALHHLVSLCYLILSVCSVYLVLSAIKENKALLTPSDNQSTLVIWLGYVIAIIGIPALLLGNLIVYTGGA